MNTCHQVCTNLSAGVKTSAAVLVLFLTVAYILSVTSFQSHLPHVVRFSKTGVAPAAAAPPAVAAATGPEYLHGVNSDCYGDWKGKVGLWWMWLSGRRKEHPMTVAGTGVASWEDVVAPLSTCKRDTHTVNSKPKLPSGNHAPAGPHKNGVRNPIPPVSDQLRPKPIQSPPRPKSKQQQQEQVSQRAAKSVKGLILFIGHPRSCSTLVGSLLDAHPHIAMAHQFDLPRRWNGWSHKQQHDRKFVFDQLFQQTRSQSVASGKLRSVSPGEKVPPGSKKRRNYFYKVNGQWQGNFEDNLLFVGDKHAGENARLVGCMKPRQLKQGNIFDDVSKSLDVPLVFVHVMRHPLDTIATEALRKTNLRTVVNGEVILNNTKLDNAAEIGYGVSLYARRANAVDEIRKRYKTVDIRCEDLEANPEITITKLCGDLGIKCPQSYVKDCARIVWAKPSLTRQHVSWTPGILDELNKQIGCFDFIKNNYDLAV
eukprot:scpid53362/ scgid2359/ 